VVPGISTELLVVVLDVFVLFEDFIEFVAVDFAHFVLEVAHLMGHVVEVGEGELRLVKQGVPGGELRVLFEHADADRPGDGDVAGVGFHFAGQHAEEGGLAGAVVADESDSLAALDGEAELVEHETVAKNFFDVSQLC
jgi:hypothetical protein